MREIDTLLFELHCHIAKGGRVRKSSSHLFDGFVSEVSRVGKGVHIFWNREDDAVDHGKPPPFSLVSVWRRSSILLSISKKLSRLKLASKTSSLLRLRALARPVVGRWGGYIKARV